MKKKQKQKLYKILSVVGVALAVIVLIGLLEWRLGRESEVPDVPVETLLKGCLMDLGLERSQIVVSGNSIKVQAKVPISAARIRKAFAPVERYGSVDVHDSSLTVVQIDERSWSIRFSYPKPQVVKPKPEPKPEAKYEMVIIVDDIGLDMNAVKKLAAIDADLTFSIMPLRPHSTEAARYLNAKNRQVMLHQPMQGGEGSNPGAGAIYTGMSQAEVRAILQKNLKSVPYIAGVNNHMGSQATQDRMIMTTVLAEIDRERLFFVDSLTTSQSVCREVARQEGIEFAARDIFLDNVQSYEYIKRQLDKLENIARRGGRAVGICHPRAVTIETLARELPELEKRGVHLVKASEFVRKL